METSWMSWKPFVVGSSGGEAGAGTFEWGWVSGQGCGADVPEWESDGCGIRRGSIEGTGKGGTILESALTCGTWVW